MKSPIIVPLSFAGLAVPGIAQDLKQAAEAERRFVVSELTDDMLSRGKATRDAVAAQDLLQTHGRAEILKELHRRGIDPETGERLSRAERRRVDRDIAKMLKKKSKQQRHV